jgi:hypothetical protein
MSPRPLDDNDARWLSTRIDGVEARLLVHIEPVDDQPADATDPTTAAPRTPSERDLSSKEGSLKDRFGTGIVSDVHSLSAGNARYSVAKKSAAAAEKAPRSMSDAHKEALAEGREQGRAVRRYLEALEANKPRRGRKRTPEGIQRRLAAIEERLPSADALSRLHLAQERMDLEDELASSSDGVDIGALEAAFVKAAGPYSQRKGIGYEAWRAAGVEPRVLKAAGIGRGQ